jgi:hypothetical protein
MSSLKVLKLKYTRFNSVTETSTEDSQLFSSKEALDAQISVWNCVGRSKGFSYSITPVQSLSNDMQAVFTPTLINGYFDVNGYQSCLSRFA